MEAYLDMWENAFNFKGRTNRRDFWTAYGVNAGVLGFLCLLFCVADTAGGEYEATAALPLLLADLYFFMMLIPVIALQIRRFHDIGHSAVLFVLLAFLSCCFLGSVLHFAFFILEGEKEENRWGAVPDPYKTFREKAGGRGKEPEPADTERMEKEFVDRYITEDELPGKKHWLRNLLILGITALLILAVQFILIYLFY